MKRFFVFSLVAIILLCASGFLKKEKADSRFEDLWSGYVIFTYTMVDKGDVIEGPSRLQWDNTKDATMFIQVTNNKGRASVRENLATWQQNTVTYASGPPSIQIQKSSESG